SSPPAILLRESYRQGGKVCSRTLANLSHLSPRQVEAMRRVLKGEEVFPMQGPMQKVRDRAHGTVDAVQPAMSRLRLERVLDRKPSRERDWWSPCSSRGSSTPGASWRLYVRWRQPRCSRIV